MKSAALCHSVKLPRTVHRSGETAPPDAIWLTDRQAQGGRTQGYRPSRGGFEGLASLAVPKDLHVVEHPLADRQRVTGCPLTPAGPVRRRADDLRLVHRHRTQPEQDGCRRGWRLTEGSRPYRGHRRCHLCKPGLCRVRHPRRLPEPLRGWPASALDGASDGRWM